MWQWFLKLKSSGLLTDILAPLDGHIADFVEAAVVETLIAHRVEQVQLHLLGLPVVIICLLLALVWMNADGECRTPWGQFAYSM
jgi:hypothetical protein